MTMDRVIAPGTVVTITYRMWNEADGELLDESGAEEPLVYLHGADNLAPGLEVGLEGRHTGERFELVLPPDQAFGEPDEDAVRTLPRDEFPDDAEIEPGMIFGAYDEEENEVVLFVLDTDTDSVTVTSNHPLAGLTLRYEVEVQGQRDARPEELEHGHPHEDGGGCGA